MAECKISYSNNDQLDWNQKKREMMLNLGLTSKNSGNDETPTPTRLIRNCEEVGLFQDLQNVNPFDEVFKKAIENPSINLQVPTNSSDDTLHTPQIYPNLEESSSATNNSNKTKSNSVKNIQGSITPIPISRLKEPDKCNNKRDLEHIAFKREANKAAQFRSRKKKKKEFEEMRIEVLQLRKENKQLIQINQNLQEIINSLKSKHKDKPNIEVTDKNLTFESIDAPSKVGYKKQLKCNKSSSKSNTHHIQIKCPKVAPTPPLIVPLNSSATTLPIQTIQNTPNGTVIFIVNGGNSNNPNGMPPVISKTKILPANKKHDK